MIAIEVVVVFLLILINGALAMSELAVVSSRRSRLQSLTAGGSRGAKIVARVLDDPTAFLSTVQIGITLVGVFAGAFSGATFADGFGDWLDRLPLIAPYGDPVAIVIVVLAITYLSLVIGELVPKRIALSDPERIASAMAPFVQLLARVASPAVWLLRNSTEGLLRVLGLRGLRESTVTEDEVRMLIAEGTRAGVFMPKEREMIEGVLRVADRTARGIMTPRSEVVWLEENATAEQIGEQLAQRRLSRFPVCRENIDTPLGIVHSKDLLRVALAGEPILLPNVLVRPLVVVNGTPVLKLLDSFRREGLHMAIVVDEYGATEGVVTLADILEAVAGELPEQGDPLEQNIVRRDDGSWLVDGSMAIDEFKDRVGLARPRGSRSYETVAGFALDRLGRLPTVGESFIDQGGRFEIIDMDGRRIDKICYSPLPEDDG
jgi:putative hemolysin